MLELNIKNLSVKDKIWLLHKLGFDPIIEGKYPIDIKLKGKPVGTLTEFELKLNTELLQKEFPNFYYSVRSLTPA